MAKTKNTSDNEQITSRKSDHIQINLRQDVQSNTSNGFDFYTFEHNALPEMNFDQIITGTHLFNKVLNYPILVSSMTGGTPDAGKINQELAAVAESHGYAMGLGSQRAAIEDPKTEYSFKVRNIAPHILLFANLGAVQLNYGYSIDHCQRAVDMIEADGLILHLNPLQEALQPEGETQFSGLRKKIEELCKLLPVPVIAKEVGWGISKDTAKILINAGIAAIDVAGSGGTSWAKVEMYRAVNKVDAEIAKTFGNWGIPTAESIRMVREVSKDIPIFASGGIRNGIDVAKSIALGATLVGFAGKFLRAAEYGPDALEKLCYQIEKELKICMFVTGSQDIHQLRLSPLHHQREVK